MDISWLDENLAPLKPIATNLQPKGSLMQPIDCLLCDIYGTLIISASGEWTGEPDGTKYPIQLISLLSRYNIKISPEELFKRFHHAIAQEHARLSSLGNSYPEVLVEEIWADVLGFQDELQIHQFALKFEMITNPVWPMPYTETLIDLCQRQGIRLGIISNAQFYTPLLFKYFFKKDLIQLGFDGDLIFFSFQYRSAKPSQILFSNAAEKLNQISIAPSKVAYIGNDMRNDILPARKAGFQTILFAGDARSLKLRKNDPRCHNLKPDMIITGLDQLSTHIRNASPTHIEGATYDGKIRPKKH